MRALATLPEDGPHDPKILMRVDWGVGAPLQPAARDTTVAAAPETAAAAAGTLAESADAAPPLAPSSAVAAPTADADAAGADDAPSRDDQHGPAFLKRALVKRAASLAAPQKRLKKSMESNADGAPLTGPTRHFINEIEIHPGYYVDWDPTPDLTIEPLANAYGTYLTRLINERRDAATANAGDVKG